MDKEMKLRAWDKFNEEFLYSEQFYTPLEYAFKDLQEFFNAVHLRESAENYVILEQFIGLKDKNGVDIYEGDIIQYGTNFIVEFDPYFCRFHRKSLTTIVFGVPQVFPLCALEVQEVIGNIHENPELLESL